MARPHPRRRARTFSALQRAEIAEILVRHADLRGDAAFSALQRAEIAEIAAARVGAARRDGLSVLFNEPKLLKYRPPLHSASLFHIPITTLRRS